MITAVITQTKLSYSKQNTGHLSILKHRSCTWDKFNNKSLFLKDTVWLTHLLNRSLCTVIRALDLLSIGCLFKPHQGIFYRTFLIKFIVTNTCIVTDVVPLHRGKMIMQIQLTLVISISGISTLRICWSICIIIIFFFINHTLIYNEFITHTHTMEKYVHLP